MADREQGSETSAMSCTHLTAATTEADPLPPTDGCGQCMAIGHRDWVHLRMCLGCGLVACCDSSPHQHATGHFRSSGHPVMRSFEPGESWRWCFVDEAIG